jgi:hypothetical protein
MILSSQGLISWHKVHEILTLTEHVLYENYFYNNKEYFKQINGLAVLPHILYDTENNRILANFMYELEINNSLIFFTIISRTHKLTFSIYRMPTTDIIALNHVLPLSRTQALRSG